METTFIATVRSTSIDERAWTDTDEIILWKVHCTMQVSTYLSKETATRL